MSTPKIHNVNDDYNYSSDYTCKDLNIELCEVCQNNMAGWNCYTYLIYRLIEYKIDETGGFLERIKNLMTVNNSFAFSTRNIYITRAIIKDKYPQYVDDVEKLLVLL